MTTDLTNIHTVIYISACYRNKKIKIPDTPPIKSIYKNSRHIKIPDTFQTFPDFSRKNANSRHFFQTLNFVSTLKNIEAENWPKLELKNVWNRTKVWHRREEDKHIYTGPFKTFSPHLPRKIGWNQGKANDSLTQYI